MIRTQEELGQAIEELQEFLDAAKPPPVGSAEAEKFSNLLDDIEHYEQRTHS